MRKAERGRALASWVRVRMAPVKLLLTTTKVTFELMLQDIRTTKVTFEGSQCCEGQTAPRSSSESSLQPVVIAHALISRLEFFVCDELFRGQSAAVAALHARNGKSVRLCSSNPRAAPSLCEGHTSASSYDDQ